MNLFNVYVGLLIAEMMILTGLLALSMVVKPWARVLNKHDVIPVNRISHKLHRWEAQEWVKIN